MKDEETDVAFLDAVEPLVQVLLPDGETVNDGAVLVLEEGGQLQHPGVEKDKNVWDTRPWQEGYADGAIGLRVADFNLILKIEIKERIGRKIYAVK